MKRIVVIGAPATGKTTLANKLGDMLSLPVYHLDKIGWKNNGVFASQEEIVRKVRELLSEPAWIIDGSMPRSKTLEMRITNADTIIFLDLPLWLLLWRQIKRFFKYYGNVRPDMGGNNIQKYPFTWKDIQYARAFPKQDIYAKIQDFAENKKVVIIKKSRDEDVFIKSLKNKSKCQNNWTTTLQ